MKVVLGAFARTGVETYLGSDAPVAVRAALAEYVRQIESGAPPVGLSGFSRDIGDASSTLSFDLAVDERTLTVLEREASRQGATIGQVVAHALLLYLAELDRLTPSGSTRAA